MGMFGGSRLQTHLPKRKAHQCAAPGLTWLHCLLTNQSNIFAASKHKACAQLSMTDLSFLPLSPARVSLGMPAGQKVLRYHQNSVQSFRLCAEAPAPLSSGQQWNKRRDSKLIHQEQHSSQATPSTHEPGNTGGGTFIPKIFNLKPTTTAQEKTKCSNGYKSQTCGEVLDMSCCNTVYERNIMNQG